MDLGIVHSVFVHGRESSMTNIKGTIKLDEKSFLKQVEKDVSKTLNKNVGKIQRILNDRIEKIVFQRLITGLPTIQGADLAEIGVPDINTRLASIVGVVAKNSQVIVRSGKQVRIEIKILRDDYSDILSLPESVYIYTSAKGSGILEWLKWILLDGTSQIIGGFEFSPLASPFSRTGGGVMVAGNGWSVPPSIAGNAGNNILTRSLQNIEQDIKIIVNQELQRMIK